MQSPDSALYIKKGALVSLPPPGTLGLYVDSSGTWKSIDESGNTSPISTGVDNGQLKTVTQDSTNIDLTVNSATDGGWELWGFLNLGTGGVTNVYLQPAANTGALAVGGLLFGQQGNATGGFLYSGTTPDPTKLVIARGGGGANQQWVNFYARFLYHDGVGGDLRCRFIQMTTTPSLGASSVVYCVEQMWAGTDSAFTTLRISSSVANGLLYNGGTNPSWVRWRKLSFTA